ncbi:MAG: hypothetical protein ACJAZX_001585 [Rickettsiales bacterium]|jgi:hypothetical protein
MDNFSSKSSKKFNLLSAFLAFILWGSWAFYVNSDSNYRGLISGLTQGTASFMITLFMVKIVTWFFNFPPSNSATFIIPSLLTICITGSVLFIIHLAIKTPNILYTIYPALTVAFIFGPLATFKLKKSHN